MKGKKPYVKADIDVFGEALKMGEAKTLKSNEKQEKEVIKSVKE